MRQLLLALTAFSVALPVSVALPGGSTAAEARTHHRHYYARSTYRSCRYSSGTTGLVAGGIGGAVIGSKVIGGGIVGPVVGAAAGALGGRAIDRSLTAHKRCYNQ